MVKLWYVHVKLYIYPGKDILKHVSLIQTKCNKLQNVPFYHHPFIHYLCLLATVPRSLPKPISVHWTDTICYRLGCS